MLVFAKGCKDWGMISDCLMDMGFAQEWWKYFGIRLYNIVIVLEATELYALKWLILCCDLPHWKENNIHVHQNDDIFLKIHLGLGAGS